MTMAPSLPNQSNLFRREDEPIILLRPLAMKASAMIQPTMMASLADVTGLPVDSQELRHARLHAAEWHRKWTMQEETAHSLSPATAALDYSREMGARNPSLSSGSDGTQSQEEYQKQPATTIRPIAVRPCFLPREDQPSPLTLASDTTQLLEQHAYDDAHFENHNYTIPTFVVQKPPATLETLKDALLHALACSAGDVDAKMVSDALLPLVLEYEHSAFDARDSGMYSSDPRQVEGMWLTLSKATYFGNLGETPAGDPMYTLGRMAFDMFLPTQLVCSLQGNFNPVRLVGDEEREEVLSRCPKSLVEELDSRGSVLRTYNIVTAFTIEPHQQEFPNAPNRAVRRPIMGIMTTYGYILPDPNVPNRLSIWFTGGKMEPNDSPEDKREWKRFFGNHENMTARSFGEKVRCLAANLLMGANPPKSMNPDGSMEFDFERPLGGHGVAYIDVIYLDDSLRVVRGHRGTIFCFARIPETNTETGSVEQW